MSGLWIGGLVLVAGWLGLAGALYLLQRLRVRHRELEVVTTLFWREAVEETRARVFRRRFRHPVAYALLLAIASLLWFAAGGLQHAGGEDRELLLVLDGSAGAAREGRFEAARERLLEDAAALPAARREVWWSGAEVRTLLRAGEPARLLEERLRGLAPEAAPARVAERALGWAAARAGAGQVRVYGDAALPAAQLALLPPAVELLRATGEPPAAPGNRGFLAAGLAEAASGRWDRVDLLVELAGAADGLRASLDGAPAELPFTAEAGEAGARLRFADLPARGQRLVLELPEGDGFALDDRAELVLPRRPLLRVALSPSLAAQLGPLLAADPAVAVAADGAVVALRRAGEAVGAGLPALVFAPVGREEHVFAVAVGPGDPEAALAEVHASLGFAEVDGLALAAALERPVSLGVETGAELAELRLDERLLDPASGFPGARSFPLLVARGLRWLAGAEDFAPVAAAGEPLALPVAAAWRDAAGRALPTAGAEFVPPAAGTYTRGGSAVAVSLLDRDATLGGAPDGAAAAPSELAAAGLPLWSWLVLLALVLLLVEWPLFQRGRIP